MFVNASSAGDQTESGVRANTDVELPLSPPEPRSLLFAEVAVSLNSPSASPNNKQTGQWQVLRTQAKPVSDIGITGPPPGTPTSRPVLVRRRLIMVINIHQPFQLTARARLNRDVALLQTMLSKLFEADEEDLARGGVA